MLAIYASAIPYGIIISYRSIISLWIGLAFFMLVIPMINQKESLLLSILCLFLTVALFFQIDKNIRWYKETTDFYRLELLASLKHHPLFYRGIIFINPEAGMTDKAVRRINHAINIDHVYGIEPLQGVGRLVPAAQEVGFKNFIFCKKQMQNRQCDDAASVLQNDVRNQLPRFYNTAITSSGWLAIEINSQF